MRRYLIAGNWKMNKTARETKSFFEELSSHLTFPTQSEILICPPFTSIPEAHRHLQGSIVLGAQNVHAKASGAFTGEISLSMLTEWNVAYVIVGHSERRTLFGETDACIHEKIKTVLQGRLKPILCVGETLEERQSKQGAFAVIERELANGLKDISAEDMRAVTIAYEPIWAIGTGETATPEIAQEMHHFIRQWLNAHCNTAVAEQVRLLYGGSLKPSNAKELLSKQDIDGGLIGGAALEAKSFAELIRIAEELSH
ncbi:MAG: triose-phosphate isomerase [Puniceicoccales bacterium]|jgi:triosephosphate isomerase|nr:triose-phosphate isomerase [Puniceicoccales bacterium]